MIDEVSRRRTDWAEGEWLTLGDGQRWCLPKPVLFARPTKFARKFARGEDGAMAMGRPVALDGDPFFSRLQSLMISDEGEVALGAAFDLFIDLIRRNYTVSDDEAAELLPYVGDAAGEQDEDNADLWRDVLDVACGRSPKASPGGTA